MQGKIALEEHFAIEAPFARLGRGPVLRAIGRDALADVLALLAGRGREGDRGFRRGRGRRRRYSRRRVRCKWRSRPGTMPRR